MNKAALFLNGQAPQIFPDLKNFDAVFCTDGAYRYLCENGIKPNVVSGDFDSLPPGVIPDDIEVISTPDQNFTDFEKALEIIYERKFKEVFIYGSSGMEHDHFLGNLTAGIKFKDKLNLIFFDDYSHYFFADKKTVLQGYVGKIISLYPFPETKSVSTKGLFYELNEDDLNLMTRTGIRNLATEEQVTINYKEGNLLIFIKND